MSAGLLLIRLVVGVLLVGHGTHVGLPGPGSCSGDAIFCTAIAVDTHPA